MGRGSPGRSGGRGGGCCRRRVVSAQVQSLRQNSTGLVTSRETEGDVDGVAIVKNESVHRHDNRSGV